MNNDVEAVLHSSVDSEFKFNYGLIILSKKDVEAGYYDILHFTGWENPPTQFDRDHVKQEAFDEFGLKEEGYEFDDLVVIDAAE
jgi:hypothetical protein